MTRPALAALALVAVVLVSGCTLVSAPTADVPEVRPVTGVALDQLGTLEVKGRSPRTGYSRDQFGPAWPDVDEDGCDERNEVLQRDVPDAVVDPDGCRVLTGLFPDPYSGEDIVFERGEDTSKDVQVDHVVALSNSWQTGASSWDDSRRVMFANDPLNLLASKGALNSAKGDGDAATWLPPNRPFRCLYVARQVAVKLKYSLWVTPPEQDAMREVLLTCPELTLPTTDVLPPLTTSPGSPTRAPSVPPRLGSCREVKAAGLGPYVRGEDLEYTYYQDGDEDGLVCE